MYKIKHKLGRTMLGKLGKVSALLMAAMLAVLVIPGGIFAQQVAATTSPTVSITTSSVNAAPGQTVDVVLNLHANDGITRFDLHVGYDPNVLRRVEIVPTNLLLMTQYAGNPFRLSFRMSHEFGITHATGQLATLRFQVLDNAPEGGSLVGVSATSAYLAIPEDHTFINVHAVAGNGAVHVTRPAPTPSQPPVKHIPGPGWGGEGCYCKACHAMYYRACVGR